MTKRLIVAALTLPLAFASPAIAQGPIDEKSLNAPGALAPTQKAPAAASKPARYKGYVQEPGYRGGRDTIVRSWSVADGASVDLGVFSIARHSSKEPSLRKYDPMKAVTGNSQHIPAVAFSLRF
jgi:hypothetical protein